MCAKREDCTTTPAKEDANVAHCPASTSSAGASPAPTSALPARVLDWLARSQAFGPSSPASFASYDPGSSSWKTSLLSLLGDSTEYSETWPKSGTTQSGRAFELPTLELATEGSGFSLWPTPIASDASGGPRKPDGKRGLNLKDMWPTPDASVSNDGEDLQQWEQRRETLKAKGVNGNGCGTPLAVAARLWPTPTAGDAKSSGSRVGNPDTKAHPGTSLTDATVRTSEARQRMNPAWVEQLMGFPAGWTDVGPPARTKINKPGKSRGRSPRKTPARGSPAGSTSGSDEHAFARSETPSSRKSRRSSGKS